MGNYSAKLRPHLHQLMKTIVKLTGAAVSRLIRWFTACRLAKAREQSAYFKAKRDLLVERCRREHFYSDEDELTESHAQYMKMEERVRILSANAEMFDRYNEMPNPLAGKEVVVLQDNVQAKP